MKMQHQIEDNWCWAAVSVSIDQYFDPASGITQCQMAQKVLGRNDCCGNPDACDERAKLQDALGDSGVKHLQGIVTGLLDFPKLAALVRQPSALPVCVRIEWAGGGAHFVAIDGVGTSAVGPLVRVADPLHGDSVWEYDEFERAYRGIGSVSHTFLLKE